MPYVYVQQGCTCTFAWRSLTCMFDGLSTTLWYGTRDGFCHMSAKIAYAVQLSVVWPTGTTCHAVAPYCLTFARMGLKCDFRCRTLMGMCPELLKY